MFSNVSIATGLQDVSSLVSPGLLSSSTVMILAGVVTLLFAVDKLLTPSVDPSEPPLLKPTIPLVGHIIGLLWRENDFHHAIFRKTPLPAATLQMLWGKVYVIMDYHLASVAFRARDASFDEFGRTFAQAAIGLRPETVAKMDAYPEFFHHFNRRTVDHMQPAQSRDLHRAAVENMAKVLNGIAPDAPLETPNFYYWIRELLTKATVNALMGEQSPMSQDAAVNDALWTFEEGIAHFITRPLPTITARAAYQARAKVNSALLAYYEAGHDLTDARGMAKARSGVLRDAGMTPSELCVAESAMLVAVAVNSGPFSFFLACFTFSDADLVARLRAEIEPQLTHGDDDSATLDITAAEKTCPLLVACFRETIRLVNNGLHMRKMVKDTVMRGADGREFLFKKGVDLQIHTGIGHRSERVWGPDAAKFRPDRWDKLTREQERAFLGFGGGMHLCPGRHFVLAEMIGLMAQLVVAFEVEAVGRMGFADVRKQPGALASNTVKPVDDARGMRVRISRRAGWDRTTWKVSA